MDGISFLYLRSIPGNDAEPGGFDDWTATLVLVGIVGGEGEVCCFRVAEVFDVDASDKSDRRALSFCSAAAADAAFLAPPLLDGHGARGIPINSDRKSGTVFLPLPKEITET